MHPPQMKPVGSRLASAGSVILCIGVFLLAGTVEIGLWMGVNGYSHVFNFEDDGIPVSGPTQIRGENNDIFDLYVREDSGYFQCDVTRADGAEARELMYRSSSLKDSSGAEWEGFIAYKLDPLQPFTVECDAGTDVVVAPPYPQGRFLEGEFGVLLAEYVGALGLLVMSAGFVLWCVGRRRVATVRS